MERIVIYGKAVRGLGVSDSFLSVPWVRDEFRSKLGFEPYPGTFNVEVSEGGSLEKWQGVRECKGIEIPAKQEGFCDSSAYRVVLNDEMEGAILLPHVSGYGDSKMEILAPASIRETLGIEEGDRVKVEVLLHEDTR